MIEPAGEVGFAVPVQALAGQLSAKDGLMAIDTDGVYVPVFPHCSFRPGGAFITRGGWISFATFVIAKCGIVRTESARETRAGKALATAGGFASSVHDFSASLAGPCLLFTVSQAT